MDNKDKMLKDSKIELNNMASVDSLLSRTELFKKDKDFFYITKKTDKIASAIYLITDTFSEREPLKWILRKYSLRSISSIMAIKTSADWQWKESLVSLQANMFELISLLETAYVGGLISQMNYSVLSIELIKLMRQHEEYIEALNREKDDVKLGGSFFDEDKGQNILKDNLHHNTDATASPEYSKGHIESFFGRKGKVDNVENNMESTDISHKIRNKRKKNTRQIMIIDLVKNNKDLSIKDIAVHIKDCSEKTIQRELTSMVNAGVLKKEGQKRWSRYSLNL